MDVPGFVVANEDIFLSADKFLNETEYLHFFC